MRSRSQVRSDRLREQISEELTRGLVEQFVTQAKANRLSYKKVIALVSDLWGDED